MSLWECISIYYLQTKIHIKKLAFKKLGIRDLNVLLFLRKHFQ